MMPFIRMVWLLLTLTLFAAGAGAQGKLADPQNAQAPVPTLNYVSPLSDYRAFAEQDLTLWRESNDTAGLIGGWRTYARETSQPESGSGENPNGNVRSDVRSDRAAPEGAPSDGDGHSVHHAP